MACTYCGAEHGVRCPIIKAIEYHPNGLVKRVEFYDPTPVMQETKFNWPHQVISVPACWPTVKPIVTHD